jgi:hypothetical protein
MKICECAGLTPLQKQFSLTASASKKHILINDKPKPPLPMIRAIVIGAAAGLCIGLIGFDVEIIVRGRGGFWNYMLAISGFAGLLVIWQVVRGFRR